MARKERPKRQKISKESLKKAKQIFQYLRPYRLVFFIGWICLAISSFISLIFPVLMGQLLGSGSEQTTSMSDILRSISMENVNQIAIGLFILFAIQAVFSFFRVILFTKVTENTLRDIRQNSFDRLVHMPMDFFNKNKVGELTSRMTSDIAQIQGVLQTTIAEFFRQLVIIVGGIVFLLIISWKLCLIMLATVPVMAIVAVLFGRFIRKLSKKAQDEAATSNSIVEEALMGIQNVKSFTNELFVKRKYDQAAENIKDLNIKAGLWRGVFISFIIFCVFGAIVFIIWQGLLMTQGSNPELASGDFFSFVMVTVMMGASFGSLPDMYASIQKSIGATENLMDIINTDGERELNQGKKTPQISGRITVDKLSFAYPQRKDVQVLDNIDLTVEKNQTIGLVGSSGSGKSTITSLLLNYYSSEQGNISFDGVKINEIELEHLRKHIAIVPQEVILFAGSIKENIAFGNPEASTKEIEIAAQKANAWEFIQDFPEKMETQVGDRGIQLSGGQKQRIAIARAILKNPTILILDEATSALDSESEKLVQDALEKLMENRTSIVIAHRLSTIRNADRIYVLENGKISEEGIHDDLIAKKGTYANLVELQKMNA